MCGCCLLSMVLLMNSLLGPSSAAPASNQPSAIATVNRVYCSCSRKALFTMSARPFVLIVVFCCCLLASSGRDLEHIKELQMKVEELKNALLQDTDIDLKHDSKTPSSSAGLNANATIALELLSRYWRNDWSNLPPEVAEIAKTLTELHATPSNNNTCWDGWKYLMEHNSPSDLGLDLPIGVQTIDAFGKLGAGLFQGNVFAYGSYDECLSLDHTEYCFTILAVIPYLDTFPFRLGACLPLECHKTDIENAINDINVLLYSLEYEYKILPGPLFLYTNEELIYCENDKHLPYNAGAIIMLTVCAIFAVLALVGTGFDWFLDIKDTIQLKGIKYITSINADIERNDGSSQEQTPLLGKSRSTSGQNVVKKRPLAFELITAFSLFKTVPTILSTKKPQAAITSLNGLRTISMFWVILGHTHLWTLEESGMDNALYVFKDVVSRYSYQAIANGFYSVDSFFFLSGVLVAYITLRHMARNKGRFPIVTFYVHRYLRLTPSYAFVLFFFWFLTMHLSNGPIFHLATDVNSDSYKSCEKYWWTNLLYINNLYPWKLNDECMGWTWYLANDMQFFVVSPLMVVLLYYSLPVGLISVSIFLMGSFAATGGIAGYYEFDPSFQKLGDHPPGTNTTFSDEIYVKPYARISPYLVGIVLGYLLYRKVKIPFSKLLNWIIYLIFWCLAAFFAQIVVYGLYDTWHGHTLSTAEDVMYITFSRFTWGIALALVVFSCHNGYGGIINSFLSMGFWIPLSRLTFNAYLVHEIVLTVVFGTLRAPVHYTDITLAVYTVAIVVISYGVAGVIAVFVEFPLGNVESVIFKMLGIGARESTRHGTEAKDNPTDLKPSFPRRLFETKPRFQVTGNSDDPSGEYYRDVDQ